MRTRPRSLAVLLFTGLACTQPSPDTEPDPAPQPPPTPAPAPADPDPEPVPVPVPAPVPEPEPDPTRGEVQAGDNLSRILRRAGLDAQAVHELTVALDGTMDPAHIREGQGYRVVLDEEGKLSLFEMELGKITRARVERNDEGELEAKKIEAETDTVEIEVGGVIERSLWAAITGSGQHPSLVSFLVDVFAYDLDFFTETHPGDTFRVIVERVDLDGEFVDYGRILAAEYAGKAGTHRVFWFDPDKGEPRYVDGDGKGVARTLLKTPLKFSRVSSEFNPKRMHPILHRVKGHNGIDYAAPEGTPVWAAADGKIIARDKRKGAGNIVILAHANGMTTLYMHLSKFAEGQKRGTNVKAKTVIGYVGMTGLATGPHLHFGVKVNGRYVDPKAVKRHRGPGVPKADRARWKRERARLVERLEGIDTTPGASAD
jgi:murein DD-endopeptidase MepM/ murein hydrolase activator NlpD